MDILEIAKIGRKIGYTFKPKMYNTDNSFHCFPCKIVLRDKSVIDLVTIFFNDYYDTSVEINPADILKIEESEYAISNEFRQQAINSLDFRGDKPFFLRTKHDKILGYNAIDIVDFTFSREFKGNDIKGCVDFDSARKLGFDFIRNHREQATNIMVAYTPSILNEINNSQV